MGYTILLVSTNLHLYCSETLRMFDEITLIDTFDSETILKQLVSGIKGIFASYKEHQLIAAQLADKYSCFSLDIRGLKNIQYHHTVRDILLKGNFPQPAFSVAEEDTNTTDSPVGYPCMVKPVYRSGFGSTFFCRTKEVYQQARCQLWENSTLVQEPSFKKESVIEQYIEGSLYSALLYDYKDRWQLLTISEKITDNENPLQIRTIVSPANLDDVHYKLAESATIAWANRLELKKGMLSIEFKFINSGPVLMNVQTALVDSNFALKELLAKNRNFIKGLFKKYTEEPFELLHNFLKNPTYVRQLLFTSQEGTINEIFDKEPIEKLPEVIDFYIKPLPIRCTSLNQQEPIGYVTVSGKDSKTALEKIHRIVDTLQFSYKEGETLSKSNCRLSHNPSYLFIQNNTYESQKISLLEAEQLFNIKWLEWDLKAVRGVIQSSTYKKYPQFNSFPFF